MGIFKSHFFAGRYKAVDNPKKARAIIPESMFLLGGQEIEVVFFYFKTAIKKIITEKISKINGQGFQFGQVVDSFSINIMVVVKGESN